MKNLLALIVLLAAGAAAADPAPFRHGVNLTEWFQAGDVGQIPVSKFGPQDFANLQSLGVDVVRLPVNFGAFVGPGPEFRLSPVLLDFLDRAVDGLLAQGLTVVLDNHSGPELPPLKGNLEGFLRSLWGQLTAHYRDRPAKLIYEIQNEPHEISQAEWDGIQHRILKIIRQVETDRLVVVTGADWGGIGGMLALSAYDDPRLIYTFHFYDPFVFTHQAADWAQLEALKGVRFPPRGGVPALAPALRSWVANDVKKYYASDAVAVLGASLDQAAAFARSRQVPIWCGEWGVYSKAADPTDRVEWYRTVRGLLDQRSIPWTIWDYRGSFGLFQPGSAESFTSDLNVPMAEAIGFTAPVQHPAEPRRLTEGFWLYRDQWGDPAHDPVWLPAGTVNFFDGQEPRAGRYSLRLAHLAQYASVGWSFVPSWDLSALMKTASVTFWARANQPRFSFDVRFLDGPAEGSDGLPWRLTATVTEVTFPGDGQWHRVTIPLASMTETGAWADGVWHPGHPGVFDPTRVGRFQIVAEQAAFGDLVVGLDELAVGP